MLSTTPTGDHAVFEGFTLQRVPCGDATLRVRIGGAGPPVLLLHGHPRTHTTWHGVAPQLANAMPGGLSGPAGLWGGFETREHT
jgi:pimeloyl-ACP methyl ester carboxylesterase